MRIVAILAFPLLVSSCSSVTHALDRLDDDELAGYLNHGAREATRFGIDYAKKKYPDKAVQIQKDGETAAGVIRNLIVKSFSGAATSDVARSAVDQAIALLGTRLSGSQVDGLVLVAGTVLAQIPFPKNPADKLDARTRKAVSAFFTGMAEGIETALNLPGPAVPPAPPK